MKEVIRKMNSNKKSGLTRTPGIFHLKDLKPRSNKNRTCSLYVEFDQDFKERLFKDLLAIAKSVRNLSKETGISFSQLWDQLTRVPFSVNNIKKISQFLVKKEFQKYSLDNLEKEIFYIKSGGGNSEILYYPNFPIDLATKSGMRLISHIYHDGSIGKNNKQPNYRNLPKEMCIQFLDDANIVFGKINRTTKWNKDKTYSVHLPTVIGEILISIGYCSGNKTKNNPPTFSFLDQINDEECISEFLAMAFNDDGCVGRRSVMIQQSSLIMKDEKKPSNVLMLDKRFLEKLGIKVNGPNLDKIYPNRYGKCTKYSIYVYSKKELRKFNEKIILIDYKKRKLENYLNNGYLKK